MVLVYLRAVQNTYQGHKLLINNDSGRRPPERETEFDL